MKSAPKASLDKAVGVFVSFGATEVYLFGSRANGRPHKGSDYDFAVRGLPPRNFFRAMGEVLELLGRPIDVVDLDEDTPFTRYIGEHGSLVRVA